MASVSEMAVAKAITNKKPKFPKKEDPDKERTMYLAEDSKPTMGMYKQMAKQNITIEYIKKTAPPPAPLPPFAPPPLEMVVGPPPAPVLTKAEQWAKLPSISAEVRAKIISDRAKDPEYQARMAYQRQREGKATAKDLEIIAKLEAFLKSSTVRR